MDFIKKNWGLMTLWLVFIVSFLFVYTEAYSKTQVDYIKEMVLAFMSASVTILITALLLRQQTRNEELKEVHSEIFKKKFEVYEEFFQNMITLYVDEINSPKNVQQLETSFYKLLLFVKNKHSVDIIYKNMMNCIQNENQNRKQIGDLLLVLREELGIHKDKNNWKKSNFINDLEEKINMFPQMVKRSN